MVKVGRVRVRNLVTTSAISSGFAVNPYVGCPHKCIYCYAACINYSGKEREEAWGDYLDIKVPTSPVNLAKIFRKKIFFSSMTDAYNPYEAKAGVTRKILADILPAEPEIVILTKSKLAVRDLDLLKKFPKVRVSFSFSSSDREFQRLAEPYASRPAERLEAMKELKRAGIRTGVFVAPIFPGITDIRAIVRAVKGHCDVFMFDSLNLRAKNRDSVLSFVNAVRPDLAHLYRDIYIGGNRLYWKELRRKLRKFLADEGIRGSIIF